MEAITTQDEELEFAFYRFPIPGPGGLSCDTIWIKKLSLSSFIMFHLCVCWDSGLRRSGGTRSHGLESRFDMPDIELCSAQLRVV